jgi:murein DD-endopeptidase MepM/ murein hydrolase activator NlpD
MQKSWRFPFVFLMFSIGTGAILAASPKDVSLPTAAARLSVRATPLFEPTKTMVEIPSMAAIPEETSVAKKPWLLFPVQGELRRPLKDSFNDRRSGGRTHNAIDILAATGAPIVAMVDGTIKRMDFHGIAGRHLYLLSTDQKHIFMYAHMSAYADNLVEGQEVKRGDRIGYVGDTGNAKGHPHLHLAIYKLDDLTKWWKGQPINPFPFISKAENAPQ